MNGVGLATTGISALFAILLFANLVRNSRLAWRGFQSNTTSLDEVSSGQTVFLDLAVSEPTHVATITRSWRTRLMAVQAALTPGQSVDASPLKDPLDTVVAPNSITSEDGTSVHLPNTRRTVHQPSSTVTEELSYAAIEELPNSVANSLSTESHSHEANEPRVLNDTVLEPGDTLRVVGVVKDSSGEDATITDSVVTAASWSSVGRVFVKRTIKYALLTALMVIATGAHIYAA